MRDASLRSSVRQEASEFSSSRLPFVFLDKIVEETDQKIVGIKNVSANEAFFVGHFPEQPVMPGVLILESLAQAAGILVRKISKEDKAPVIAGSDKMRFRRPVVPGDQLILEVELIEWNGSAGKFKGVAKVADQVAAAGDLSMTLEHD